MRQQGTAAPRGLLRQKRSFEHFDLELVPPAPELADHIEHHWLITWDLRGRPSYRQQNLGHPTQHLVINPQGQSGIFGVTTGTFDYVLAEAGRVLGTKFRPGAFRGLYGRPVSRLTDAVEPLGTVFPREAAELERALLAAAEPADLLPEIEAMLHAALPPVDERALTARRVVETIEASPELASVAAVARRAGMSARSLQRLFDDHVGVSPKWVIDRYRMIEAVEALNRGEPVSLVDLAMRLGYFDQAHFSKRFAALTGTSPGQYAAG